MLKFANENEDYSLSRNGKTIVYFTNRYYQFVQFEKDKKKKK